MSARVCASEVKQIISTSVEDEVLTANFIDTAHAFVEANLVGNTCELTDAILAKIEMYLAAHFVALASSDSGSGSLKFEKLGDASESYDVSNLGAGLNSTSYGQTAVVLDTCGVLAGLATPMKRAEFRVI